MSYSDKLIVEINSVIDRKIAAGLPLLAQWITHEVCEAHDEGLAPNDHSDFWRHSGYKATRDEVRRCINRRIGDQPGAADRQMVFDGFEQLQRYYMVDRDGDQIGVPVQELTDEEIEGKAATYRSMGAACFAHADELDRYRHWRTTPPLLHRASASSSIGGAA